jgi:predicted MFS family arabinose efflux permease
MVAVGVAGLSGSSAFAHLVAANICVGTGLSTTMAGASLYLADISTPRNRAASTAPLLQSALLGFTIGPAIGGFLAQQLGVHSPFMLCSAALIGSSCASLYLLPETLHDVRRRSNAYSIWNSQQQPSQQQPSQQQPVQAAAAEDVAWGLLRRPALQGIGAHVFTNGFSQGAFPVTLVLFAVEHMGMSSAAVGAMLTANVGCMVVATRPATRLSDSLSSRKSIMVPAMLGSALFAALQPLSDGPTTFAILVGLGGISQAVSMPSISPLILDSTTVDERARALAGRQMAQDFGQLLGAFGTGFIANAFGIPVAMEAVAMMQASSTFFFAMRVPARPTGADRGSN